MVQTRSARKAAGDKGSPAPSKATQSLAKAMDAAEPAKLASAWTTGRDGLYPTVAISDAFSATAHAWAAWRAFQAGALEAAAGFGIVAAASFVGVLRFGYSETLFEQANADLADLSAYLGLPLVRRRAPTFSSVRRKREHAPHSRRSASISRRRGPRRRRGSRAPSPSPSPARRSAPCGAPCPSPSTRS